MREMGAKGYVSEGLLPSSATCCGSIVSLYGGGWVYEGGVAGGKGRLKIRQTSTERERERLG